MILDLKIVEVDDDGFNISVFDTNGDQRVPIMKLVATGLPQLFTVIQKLKDNNLTPSK